jgi:hypothetical protein
MQVVAKVKCRCGRWVRIRDNKIPSDIVSCWNCNAAIQLTWVNHSGGNAKVTQPGKSTVTVYDVDVEALELP